MISIFSHSQRLGELLLQQNKRLALAESCTGGWLAKSMTDHAGSSEWFECGLTTYSNRAKCRLLGVSPQTLDQHGAVSEAVAREMVQGLFRVTDADMALTVTGIAGPDGGSPEKPVGTVWFAWGWRGQAATTQCRQFSGDRAAVREQAVAQALEFLGSDVQA
jgi:nicotinamide-nucleotide amidase